MKCTRITWNIHSFRYFKIKLNFPEKRDCHTLCCIRNLNFESHQCFFVQWFSLSCHAGCYDVSRCHTRGESEKSIACTKHARDGPTLALKPLADITRSPNKCNSGPTKRNDLQKFKRKEKVVPLRNVVCEFSKNCNPLSWKYITYKHTDWSLTSRCSFRRTTLLIIVFNKVVC